MGEALEQSRLPGHVGIVMDGNGRWAKKRRLPRVIGHQAGMKALERVIDAAKEIGIRYLSVYAFSTENWRRPSSEVQGLMGLFRYYLKGKMEQMHRRNARVRFAGRMDAFPEDILKITGEAERKTEGNDGIDVIFCTNYGGRQEILDAASKLLASGHEGSVTEELLRGFMYVPDVPDPDLLIRTGGELRMSNFWLWEGAYSEYYFTDVLWPDFERSELERALASYAGRERRYGTA
ncbi:MAG: di-trans,poly-cis-decaprenylcistransferase [Synergistaceae bacterium]|jgi:undecaprenyl diphosphate synthase|nr:di-trans,poly-cis-decaprenylcistransferase [Synergistaceae bacterium]